MQVIVEAINTPSVFQFEGDEAELRLYATIGFQTSDGQLIGQGFPTLNSSWYLPITCEIQATGILYVPSFQVDSTTDGFPRVAKYQAALFDSGGSYVGPFPITNPNGFAIPPSLTSLTWGDLAEYNRAPTLLYPPPTYPTVDLVRAMIAQALSQDLLKSSETQVGNTALSEDPFDPAWPIAVSTSDPLWLALVAGSIAVPFSQLPSSPVEGRMIGITDSNTGTFGATITAGGGVNKGIAYFDGTNWTFR